MLRDDTMTRTRFHKRSYRAWAAREWTPEQNATIIRMCAAPGMRWQWIADELGIARATVINHAHRKLDVTVEPAVVPHPVGPAPYQPRGPLAAGAAQTWGLISGGAVWPGVRL